MELANLTLKEFLGKTAGNEPVPGGGSISALNGAIAAALAEMVANLTIGRKKYADVDELMQTLAPRFQALQAQMTHDIDRDSEAYDRVFNAFKLPKETDEEKAARREAIQRETKYAAQVPMEVARAVAALMPDIATVGRNMNSRPGTSGRLFAALGKAGVNIRMIAQGSAELNIIVGVSNKDFNTAIACLYETFSEEMDEAKARANQ